MSYETTAIRINVHVHPLDFLEVPIRKFRTFHMLRSVGVLTLALTVVSRQAASVEVKTPKVVLPRVTVKPTVPNHPKSHTPQGFFDSGGNQLYINRTTNLRPSSSGSANKAATGAAPNIAGTGSGNLIAPPSNAGTGGGIFTGTGAGSGNLIAPNLIAAPPNNAIAPPSNGGTGGGIFTGTGAGSSNLIAPNNAGTGNPANVGTPSGYSSVTPQKLLLPPK